MSCRRQPADAALGVHQMGGPYGDQMLAQPCRTRCWRHRCAAVSGRSDGRGLGVCVCARAVPQGEAQRHWHGALRLHLAVYSEHEIVHDKDPTGCLPGNIPCLRPEISPRASKVPACAFHCTAVRVVHLLCISAVPGLSLQQK